MTLNPADPTFAAHLRSLLPDEAFRDPAPHYLEEPRGRWTGQAGVVVAPSTADGVATVIRAASEAQVGVVPYGGGTGLVGGQVQADGSAPILLSLERMRKVRAVYPQENVMVVEAGAILSDIHDAAQGVDRLFPLTIAAKGSARIGGNLATNAGGVNVLRYGNARDLCLGLEAVLPDGRIWHGLKRLRKDNTGYDLKNLLIGSEGTLGVITAAALKLYPRPAGEGTALMVVESPEAALALLALARDHLGEGVSAFELMHRMGLDFLAETLPDLRQPFATPPEWFVLIDVGLARGLDPGSALEALFAEALEAGLVHDGMIAQSEAQRHAVLGGARKHPRGQPARGFDQFPRYFGPDGRDPRFHSPGRGGHRGPGRFPDQLLRASGRRQPALQRLSAQRAGPGCTSGPARGDQAGRA